MTIEPLMRFRVIKDLVVDMEPFFARFRSVLPFLVTDAAVPQDGRERRQSVDDRARFDDTTKCILRAACTTSCPSFWADENFVGPAAMVNAHRFIFDSRDDAADERLEILNDREGVWRAAPSSTAPRRAPARSASPRPSAEVKKAILKGSARAEPSATRLPPRRKGTTDGDAQEPAPRR